MTDIVIQVTLNGEATNALADTPEMTIIRLDTDAIVVNADGMNDVGNGGLYSYQFTGGIAGVRYGFSADADPNETGQTDVRFYGGAFDNEVRDIWNDRGLNPSQSKTITEVTEGEDYDEAVTDPDGPNIAKDTTKVGAVTTIDRAP